MDFFFVLSGFIIFYVHEQHINKTSYLPVYLWRRVTRIYPIYWIALVSTLILGFLHSQHLPDLQTFTRSLFLLPGNYKLPLDVAWTLVAEMQFYIFFGIFIVNRWVGLTLFLAWQGITIASYFELYPAPYFPVSAYHLQFLMGIIAAYGTQKLGTIPYLLHSSIVVFLGVSLLENTAIIDGYGNIARLLYGIPSMGILIGLTGLKNPPQNKLIARILGVLGSSTYSIYLFHLLFISVFLFVAKSLIPGILHNVWVLFIPTVCFGIIGGVLVSILIELPLLKYTKGLFPKNA